jgi:cellulose synthase/poly-beta-1,6-N-acetylglucosamine synthase-like glycosyltransferase
MEKLQQINNIIAIMFFAAYFYQLLYILIALPEKRRENTHPAVMHRFAVLISARNEELVLPQLLDSIKHQNYPAELIDIFVAADNCTDSTAEVARKAGAVVWERQNKEKIGKGYALAFLLDNIKECYSDIIYDGYLILDADNLLDVNYIAEMNKSFSEGYRILTSYRNSKNYDSNWIAAGYSLWFLREAKYLNRSRHRINVSCAVSGTGFLVHRDIIEKNGGWKHFLLTEDIEFTVDSVLQGETIGICERAVLYDEQPVTFAQSWRQRLRWAKGFLQVFGKYGFKLIVKFVKSGSFSCFDMVMSTMPAIFLSVLGIVVNFSAAVFCLLTSHPELGLVLKSILESVRDIYLVFFSVGLLTTVTEWKMIYAKASRKILYMFSFPIFMFTYIPIAVAAMFLKVEWKPIRHNIARSLADMLSAAGETEETAEKRQIPRVG